MIALNDLLERIDEYKAAYNKLGFNYDLDIFIALENERKTKQLLCENLRATCNKKCGEIAKLKLNGLDTAPAMREILQLDAEANRQQKKLEKLGKAINGKLRRLKNLPDEVLNEDKVLKMQEKSGIMTDIYLSFFDKIHHKFDGSIKKFMKTQSGVLYLEKELPKFISCADGFVLLAKDYEVDALFHDLIEFLSAEASMVIRKESKKTPRYCADAYDFKYFNGQIKVELVREFYTREFSIKYRNISIDATKFVNQINIKKG